MKRDGTKKDRHTKRDRLITKRERQTGQVTDKWRDREGQTETDRLKDGH